MADKSAKSLDGVVLNQKRKRATRCLAHLAQVATPTNLVAKPADYSPAISRSFVKYYFNYKKSGLPKRLMFYKNGEWLDYPEHVVDLVKKDFEIKKETVEIELDGHGVVMDFLLMYNLNLKTGLRQHIAWIDEAGSCFFPEVFASFDEEPNNLGEEEDGKSDGTKEAQELKLLLSIQLNGTDESKLAMDVDIDGNDTTTEVGNENVGETANQDRERDLDAYIEPGYGNLDVDCVRNIFLRGMTTFGVSNENIVAIYPSSGFLMQARLEVFLMQADMTKSNHKDANVRYGWLACSEENLSMLMDYGLSYDTLSTSTCIYGFGFHLAAIDHPYACAPYCDVKYGITHLVLCRVIMGNMEPLRRGNRQICPSSCEYDNGVDDIEHPKYYVVWNRNMHTHIYPEFVVCFKVPLDVEGNKRWNEILKDVSGNSSSTSDTVNAASLLNIRRGPRPLLPFMVLFDAIRSRISENSMLLIKDHYLQFIAKKISHKDFMMKMRLIVGDDIMRSVTTNLQFNGPSNDGPDGGVTENF